MGAILKTEVIIDSVDVGSKLLNWKITDSLGEGVNVVVIEVSKNVDDLVVPEFGQEVTVKRGAVVGTEQFNFKGVVIKREDTGFSYKITCYDELYKAIRGEITYTYDKDIDASAGQGSEIFLDIVNTHTSLTANSTSVQATSTEDAFLLRQFPCRNADPYDKLRELAELYNNQFYYKASTDLVYMEPKGFNPNTNILTVGGNVTNRPKWLNDGRDLINFVTVFGATQEVETTQAVKQIGVTSGWTAGDGGLGPLDEKPTSVKVWADAATPPTTLRVGGKKDSVTPYDYDVDKENQQLKWSTSNAYTWPADHYVLVEITYPIPIPVSAQDETSIASHGTYKKTLHPKEVQTVSDAEIYANQILADFSEPFKNTKLEVVGIYDVEAGQTIRVVDSRNGVDEDLLVNKVIYRWPHSTDIVHVGPKELTTGDFEVDVLRKLKEFDELLRGDSNYTVHLVNLKHQIEVRRKILEVWNNSILGTTILVWDHDLYGEWGVQTWGAFYNEGLHYSFEEGSGTEILDRSPNGLYGTLYGSSFVSGKVGSYAIRIGQNTDDYLDVPSKAMSHLKSWTVAAWIKLTALNTTHTLLSAANSSDAEAILIKYVPGDNEWVVTINEVDYSFSNSDVEDLGDHHVFIVRNYFDRTIHLFVDNSEVGTGITTEDDLVVVVDQNGLVFGQLQTSVGAGFTSGNSLYGDLDDLRIYPYHLTSTERGTIYNSGTGTAASLEGWSQHYRADYT